MHLHAQTYIHRAHSKTLEIQFLRLEAPLFDEARHLDLLEHPNP